MLLPNPAIDLPRTTISLSISLLSLSEEVYESLPDEVSEPRDELDENDCELFLYLDFSSCSLLSNSDPALS